MSLKLTGNRLERFHSLDVHRDGIPLLVAPSILRSYGCGQIDIANIKKIRGEWVITVYEIKSSQAVSKAQTRRLMRSSQFLGDLFEMAVRLNFKFADG